MGQGSATGPWKLGGEAADELVDLVVDDHPECVRTLPVILGHFGSRDASFLSVSGSIGRLETDRIAELVLAESTRTVSQLVLKARRLAALTHSTVPPTAAASTAARVYFAVVEA